MVGSIIWVFLEIYLAFQQWKNFENPLRIDKVIAMCLVYYFFGRGAPDPDPAGYPVNFVDPVRIRIRPDPETVDPVEIRIRPDPT